MNTRNSGSPSGDDRNGLARLTLLAAIVDSSEDAIVSKDLEGVVTSWNRGAERLYGYSAEEIVGRSVSVLTPDSRPDEMTVILERICRGEHIEPFETVRVNKDGARIAISLAESPILDGDGAIIGASGIAREITEPRPGHRRGILVPGQLADQAPQRSSTHELAVPDVLAAPILVIEGNAASRKQLRLALERAGHLVVEAHDATTAMAAAQRRAPALIFLDSNLPNTDTAELTRRLHAQLGIAVPIVCVCGFLARIDEARAHESGFVQVLVKPIDPQELRDIALLHLTELPVVVRYGDGLRALVVDDDPLQRKLLQFRLAAVGFDVSLASDGQTGLAMARSALPDIIVSDILMPTVDGFALCLALRSDAATARIPVVLSSAAYIDAADHELAMRLGASAMIPKSVGLDAVMAGVRAAVGSSPPPLAAEATELLAVEHGRRGLWQLERQLLRTTRLVQRTTQQQAQLAVLACVADALANSELDGAALGVALAACLDMAGIGRGALYLAEASGRLVLHQHHGFSAAEAEDLRSPLIGEEAIADLAVNGDVVLVPSAAVSAAVAHELLARTGATSLLLVPLVWGVHTLGVILLGGRSQDIRSEDARAFARVLGAQMGQAVSLSRAFANLAASEHRYRTLADNANDAIVILSRDGIIRESNRRLTEILGFSNEQLVGSRIQDWAVPGRERERVPAGPGRAAPVELVRKDGTRALMEFSTAPVTIGNESLILSIGRDVTEQVQSQAQLMVSDRMASVGALAAGVAHEINNPLAAVIMNLEIAAGTAAATAELQEILDDAKDAAYRVSQIIKDLRIFSRAEKDTRGRVELRSVLESTLRMAANEIRHRARLVKNYGAVPEVDGNEARLGQVFLNLIMNAAQAIPDGHVGQNQITVTTSKDEHGNAVIEVQDTGPGMPEDVLRKLFTPFFTTKSSLVGTGLGLTICQRIISGIGGAITVASTVGVGTVVRVVLPPAQLARMDEIPERTVSPAVRRGRILVVDDDPVIAVAVRRTLEAEHDVVCLTSVRDALDRISSGEHFDVILCDVMMPLVTGGDFYRQLALVSPEQVARIVFMTGGAFTVRARVFLDEVPNHCIEKPFHVQNLRALVNGRVR